MQLMPLIHEMPRGDVGIRLTRQAVTIVVMGTPIRLLSPYLTPSEHVGQPRNLAACRVSCQLPSQMTTCDNLQSAGIAIVVYGLVGVFGAARYGLATEGDLLVNSWLHGRAEGIFDAVLVAYLAISIPPIQVPRVRFAAKSQGLIHGVILWGWFLEQHCFCMSAFPVCLSSVPRRPSCLKCYSILTSCMTWQLSLRYTLDCLVAGEDAPFSRRRHLALTSAAVFSSLAVALAFPDAAEKILAITGATAVAAVCYLIPVALHFMQRREAHAAVGPGPLLAALHKRRGGAHGVPILMQVRSREPSTVRSSCAGVAA